MLGNQRGLILWTSWIFVAVITLVIQAMLTRSMTELMVTNRFVATQQAFSLAEAGLDDAVRQLLLSPSYQGTDPDNDGLDPADYVILSSGRYRTNVTQPVANQFLIQSTGSADPATRQASLLVEVTSSTPQQFARQTDVDWIPGLFGPTPVWDGPELTINGPYHTNGNLNVSFTPTFKGHVTTGGTTINYRHGGPPTDNPDFQDGYTLGVSAISVPTDTVITDMKTASQNGGLYLMGTNEMELIPNGDTTIIDVKAGSGYFEYQTVRGRTQLVWVSTARQYPLPTNGVLFSEGEVLIWGTLRGKLTVATDDTIQITNHLDYYTDPKTNPDSTDILGLASQLNLVFDSAAPYDLRVNAVLLNVSRDNSYRIRAETYDSALRGTLEIYGSVISYWPPTTSTHNKDTGAKTAGYTTTYTTDPRLNTLTPPAFPPFAGAQGGNPNPGQDQYKSLLWQE